MSERFNVLMCKFYKFYVCAVVGIIIEWHLHFSSVVKHVGDERGDIS